VRRGEGKSRCRWGAGAREEEKVRGKVGWHGADEERHGSDATGREGQGATAQGTGLPSG